jgi:hypothetical protein
MADYSRDLTAEEQEHENEDARLREFAHDAGYVYSYGVPHRGSKIYCSKCGVGIFLGMVRTHEEFHRELRRIASLANMNQVIG